MTDHPGSGPYAAIPEHTRESIDAWVESARPVGGFLQAVLSNDLSGAFARADLDNQRAMHAIVSYLYNECPGGCWGSPERYRTWPEERERLAALTARLNEGR
jgi:hypothetical protein